MSITAEPSLEELKEITSMKTTSSKRTFYDVDRDRIYEVFWAKLEAGQFLSSSQIDSLAKAEFPDLFDRYGAVKLRNKFREYKARFLRMKAK